jgi:hypothetical protein
MFLRRRGTFGIPSLPFSLSIRPLLSRRIARHCGTFEIEQRRTLLVPANVASLDAFASALSDFTEAAKIERSERARVLMKATFMQWRKGAAQ